MVRPCAACTLAVLTCQFAIVESMIAATFTGRIDWTTSNASCWDWMP